MAEEALASKHSGEVEPSALGTREYWDELYGLELANNDHDPQDTGTKWFDDADAEERMVQYLASVSCKSDHASLFYNHSSRRILDLGTGNGHLLFRLRNEGYVCHMVGIDYSEASVQLCRRIAEQQSHTRFTDIEFHSADFLGSPEQLSRRQWIGDRFDIVLDKGTFDAISLSSPSQNSDRGPCKQYVQALHEVLKPGGLFLIVSCNFTNDELKDYFANSSNNEISADAIYTEPMEVLSRLSFPTFQFGGITGQSVYGLCFRKRAQHKS